MSQLFGMDFLSLNNRVNQAEKKADKANTNPVKNTIGKPELSKEASSYYEKLKAKFGDAEFILVDDEQVKGAQEYASNVATDKKAIVMISESELEEMAKNEDVRTKNENFISDAMAKMPGIMEELEEAGAEVKSYGMQFNDDGTVSYFAVLDKAAAAQKERMEAIRADKAEAAKEAKRAEATEARKPARKEDLTTVTASSLDELIKKIKDTMYEAKSDYVITDREKMVGQKFDMKF